MAFLQLPARSDVPAYSYQVDLDGTDYTLRFTYNERMGKWILDVREPDGTPIVEGVPIIADYPILDRFQDIRLPPGRIFAFDTSGTNTDPGRFDFGKRVIMVYEEEGTT